MRTLILLVLIALLTGGCARRYTITTNGGGQIQAKGKPRLEGGAYIYKDLQGRPSSVPAGRVREIAPASMVQSSKDQYGK